MSDYANYIFTLGKDKPRTYKGDRLRPMEGFQLGIDVAKVLASMLSVSEKEDGIEALKTSNQSKLIYMIAQCLSEISSEQYMGFLRRILTKTVIEARGEDNKTVFLCKEDELNTWFAKYPADLLQFSARVIWENASPFLPEEFQNLSLDMAQIL